MTPLHDLVAARGATIRPHPAVEPVAGDGGLVVVTPSERWRSVDEHRSDTTVALLVAPDLARGDMVPNAVGTTSIVTGEVPADQLLEAAVACMDVQEGWHVRARSEGDDGEVRTLDLLGEYRLGEHRLALSSQVVARRAAGHTVLLQSHVTTFADQIDAHESGLRAMAVPRA